MEGHVARSQPFGRPLGHLGIGVPSGTDISGFNGKDAPGNDPIRRIHSRGQATGNTRMDQRNCAIPFHQPFCGCMAIFDSHAGYGA